MKWDENIMESMNEGAWMRGALEMSRQSIPGEKQWNVPRGVSFVHLLI